MDSLFGYMGIDTKYERDLLHYQPILSFIKKKSALIVSEEVGQMIERSEMFPVYQTIQDYEELIRDLKDIIAYIAKTTDPKLISQADAFMNTKDLTGLFQMEKETDEIKKDGLLDIYSMCHFLLNSMEFRLDDIISKYISQFSEETSLEKIEEDEKKSILEWKTLESKTTEAYSNLMNEHDEDDHVVDGYVHENVDQEMIEELEKLKYEKEMLHTTLADLAFIHRNRFFMMLEAVEKIKILVFDRTSLVRDGLEELIYSVHDASDKRAALIAHLLMSYKKEKDKHHSSKFKYLEYQASKERFASDKQYFHQQVELKTKQPLTEYLYSNMEQTSNALDKFNTLMVDSMEVRATEYETILAEMLNFYRSESIFYDQILMIMKKKQEMSVFYRICMDLEEQVRIDAEWVDSYIARLTSND